MTKTVYITPLQGPTSELCGFSKFGTISGDGGGTTGRSSSLSCSSGDIVGIVIGSNVNCKSPTDEHGRQLFGSDVSESGS